MEKTLVWNNGFLIQQRLKHHFINFTFGVLIRAGRGEGRGAGWGDAKPAVMTVSFLISEMSLVRVEAFMVILAHDHLDFALWKALSGV